MNLNVSVCCCDDLIHVMHIFQNSLFGEGIYLSTEQSLSLHYSPCGQGWSKSKLGTELSILALCEVIDHPDVKRQSKSITETTWQVIE